MDPFITTTILMGLFIIQGLVTIITKRLPFNGTGKYTEESMRAYAVPRGVLTILFSLNVIGFSYALRKTKFSMITLAVFALMMVILVLYFVVKKKMLVRI